MYLTTIITAVMALALIGCAMFESTGGSVKELAFVVPRRDWGNAIALWLYPFIGSFNIFTALAIYCFYGVSVGVESHMGRSVLVRLLLALIVVPAAAVTVLAYGFNMPEALAGNSDLLFGMLVAFATLYPNVLFMNVVAFKYVAAACIVFVSLISFKRLEILPLLPMWSSSLVAFLYMRHAVGPGSESPLPLGARMRSLFRRRPKLRVVPRPETSPDEVFSDNREQDEAVSAEVDAILDKVARTGLNSLTESEHRKLQKAREELQRRDRR